MLFLLGLLVVFICVGLSLLTLVPTGGQRHLGGPRAVGRPQDRRHLGVSFDVLYGAASGLTGCSLMSLGECTWRPPQQDSTHDCTPEAPRAAA